MTRCAKITTVLFVAALVLLTLSGPVWAVPGMVSYWKFDEGIGVTAYDCWGDNHGTLFNGPVWDTGIVNNALYFERGKYVEIPDSDDLDFTTSLSIEAWVRANYSYPPLPDPHNDHQLVSKSSGCCDSYMLFYGWGNDLIFCIRTNMSGFVGQAYNVPNHDSWHHLVGTWDGFYMRLYVDGNKVLGKDGFYDRPATGTISPNSTPLRIAKSGRKTGPYYENFYGWIDEVAVYNRALTLEEIQQHYWNGLNGQGYLAIEVAIDIKPGTYPNAINLGSHGLIPVAILSSQDFDATTVDPDTVELGGADVAVRGKGNRFMAHEEDVNADGLLDLVVQVATANLDPDSFQDGYAVLTGTTYGGLPIWGVDEIIIVPPEE